MVRGPKLERKNKINQKLTSTKLAFLGFDNEHEIRTRLSCQSITTPPMHLESQQLLVVSPLNMYA